MGGDVKRQEKETNSERVNRQKDALEAEGVLARVEEKRDRAFFPLLPHPAHWREGPGRELRLIGSFGLEKWISSPKKLVSFQTK